MTFSMCPTPVGTRLLQTVSETSSSEAGATPAMACIGSCEKSNAWKRLAATQHKNHENPNQQIDSARNGIGWAEDQFICHSTEPSRYLGHHRLHDHSTRRSYNDHAAQWAGAGRGGQHERSSHRGGAVRSGHRDVEAH